ncbi:MULTISPECIES: general secretion pathway protein GspC [Leptospira]|uniref:General secretion pathway protein GspC n=1 Tax=Leptospira paudalimensis TaxID=2950024 RepID=A0ABT3M6W3_9LEPT|nr:MULTISPECIES: general secretion pathway protein GspC [Leptospira]MCW7504126.1 general secretion pathway protein GspC [Leptospira paudalimensis]TGM83003.1 general secretion pathway protein GspC [Leptospira levettii]
MNLILQRIQSSQFLTLIPVVLLFSFSLAYLLKLVLLLLFSTETGMNVGSQVRPKQTRQEVILAVSTYEDMVTGNLIRGQVFDPNDATKRGADGSPLDPEIAQDNGDDDQMLVTGTLSGHWSFARVTIREKQNNDSEEYGVGEMVGGYKVQTIEQHYVVLKKGGLSLRVNIGETPAQAKERIRPKDAAAVSNLGPSSQTIQKVLSREDVNRKLKDPNTIYKNARFGPHLVDGKIEGYKIYQVAKDHVFYSLGARGGDIIKRVNGMPLNETEKMLEIWGSIKQAPKITVDLERQGKIITYEFIIRN